MTPTGQAASLLAGSINGHSTFRPAIWPYLSLDLAFLRRQSSAVFKPGLAARKRILVIEGAPEVIAKLLRAGGHLTMNASDEEAALSLWKRAAGGFDVVIIDDRVLDPARVAPQFTESKPAIRLILMVGRKAPAELPGANIVVLPKPVSQTRLNEAVAAD